MWSQKTLTGCKTPILEFLTTHAHTYNVGFDGFFASCTTFEVATQDVFGMHCPNYRRHSTKHMNGRYERSTKQPGNLLTDYSNVLPLLPGRSKLRNWRSFSHSISSQDRLQSSEKNG